jgi:hypothetical protein
VDDPDSVDQSLLDNTHLVGLSLRFSWAALEPEAGKLDTTLLDAKIVEAKNAGKKIQLRVIPGERTPDWVYLQGVPSVYYPELDPENTGEFIKVPVPWDAEYLAAWTSFITRLGRHLEGTDSITLVHMTGANSRSGEFHLTSGALSSDTTAQYWDAQGQVVATGTVNDLWLQNGDYTLDNIRMAWAVSRDAWAAAFPSPKLAYNIVNQVHKQDDIDNEVNLIVEDAYRVLQDRLTLQNNGHHDDASVAAKLDSNTYQIIQAYAPNLDTGFQSSKAHITCSVGDLGPALAVGAYLYGADYFELYLKEIEKYPEIVQECNDFLLGNGESCGTAGSLSCTLDTEAPTVSILSPQDGGTVSGEITVEADVSDNLLVFGVGLSVDGSPIGPEQIVSVPPTGSTFLNVAQASCLWSCKLEACATFYLPWSTTSVGNGPHTLTVTARDVSGNRTEASIQVIAGQ